MNNKKSIWFYLCAALLICLTAMTLLTGCKEEENPPPGPDPKVEYTVTVENGSGGGKIEKDASCTVRATVPAGEEFLRWTADGKTISKDNPFSFSVTGNMTIKAVTGSACTLFIDGGKITGTDTIEEDRMAVGESVSVTAKSTQNKKFLYFLKGDDETQITQNPYVFTMEGDTDIKGIFDETCLVSVAGGTVYADEKPEEAGENNLYKAGDKAFIQASAAPAGQKFAYWYSLDSNRKEVVLSEQSQYSFVVTGSKKVYAKFDYFFVVSVEGGYIGNDKTATSADVFVNKDVTVTAEIPLNKGFTHWEVNGEVVSKQKTYTFKVTGTTAIKAVFADHIRLATLANDKNQMIKYVGYGSGRNVMEFDRFGSGDQYVSAFIEGIAHIKIYVYTASNADKGAYVSTFIIKQIDKVGKAALCTPDGTVVKEIGSTPGNYYFDHVNNSSFEAIFKKLIGDDYSASRDYYFAAQAIAEENSVYLDSEISVIGTSSIKH